MHRIFQKCFFLLVCLYGLFFFLSEAKAFSVFPLRHSVVVDPGKSESVFIDLKNDASEFRDFVFEVDAFALNPDNGNIQFGKSDEAKAWLTPKPATVRLDAGESKRVVFTLQVPSAASPGSHYLALVAREKSTSGQVSLGARIATLLFLHVSGPVQELLTLRDFSFEKGYSFRSQMQSFLQFHNGGTIHLVPEGKMVISNWRGGKISEITVNVENRKILPGENWNRQVKIENLRWKDFGRVQVDILMQYGLTESLIVGQKTFWYIPWQIVLPVGILLILTLVFVFWKRRLNR